MIEHFHYLQKVPSCSFVISRLLYPRPSEATDDIPLLNFNFNLIRTLNMRHILLTDVYVCNTVLQSNLNVVEISYSSCISETSCLLIRNSHFPFLQPPETTRVFSASMSLTIVAALRPSWAVLVVPEPLQLLASLFGFEYMSEVFSERILALG